MLPWLWSQMRWLHDDCAVNNDNDDENCYGDKNAASGDDNYINGDPDGKGILEGNKECLCWAWMWEMMIFVMIKPYKRY